MNALAIVQKDPFRVFFPLGALFATLGIAPWVPMIWAKGAYLVDFHRGMMINGFLLSFVAGFLITSVPRFTTTSYAMTGEIIWVFSCLVAAAIAGMLSAGPWSHLLAALAIGGLGVFGIRRFWQRQQNPPFTFIFVGIGLLLLLLSNIMIFLESRGVPYAADHQSIWRELFSNGAVLSIVLGVGGRLIPGILGWQAIVSTQRSRYEQAPSYLKAVPVAIWIAMCLFLASYFLNEHLPAWLCYTLRAIVVWFFGLRYWRLYHFPPETNFVARGVWCSSWSFLIGALLPIFWDSYAHVLHLTLIGGFSLLTFLVATRVTLAHSKEGRGAEHTAKSILIFTVLFLFSAIVRVTSIIWPQVYLSHLGYAAALWIVGIFLWALLVFSRLGVRSCAR